MPPDLDRRLRPRLTIRQICILVIVAAAVSAVIMPQFRHQNDPRTIFLIAAVETPYLLMIPTLLLVRRGPGKTCLFASLGMVSILGFAIYSTLLIGQATVVVLVVDALLIGLMARLSTWIIPRSCPACRRPAMLRDPSVPGSSRFPPASEARTCVACGSRFRRHPGSHWVDVDILLTHPRPIARHLPSMTEPYDR